MGQWLSGSQAAEYLGVTRNTIYRWCEQGKLVFSLTPGGHRRFQQEDLDAMMLAQIHRQRVSEASEVGGGGEEDDDIPYEA